ncbi:hypothetical protein GL272_01510 [Aeromonas veronii]|uniref:hypothetical protein n=1 Tax=Aeromonas veronii TaxID=654 RepID=UPI001C5BCF36|nr:hypothetical protein [Aeromonas veronii]MBW3775630.1 hypothetical protein [Aeromonas veronii]
MNILKKDFVNEDTESYCGTGRILSSGTAYYMQDANGVIHYGGRHCAEMHGKNNIKDVPDLTKSLVSLAGAGAGAGAGAANNDQKKSLAIAYLLLREELLHDFNLNNRPLSYVTLNNYYRTYLQNGNLSDNDIKHILNIESYSTKKIDKKLSLKNLSTCHAYNFILDRICAYLIKNNKEDGISFVTSLKKHLRKNCCLTQNQIDGLNRWIQYLPHDLKNAKLKDFD